jgi:hypothetical protein
MTQSGFRFQLYKVINKNIVIYNTCLYNLCSQITLPSGVKLTGLTVKDQCRQKTL